MKKLWNTAFIYFWLAMAGGVFYREFTKFNDYSGKTVLGLLHVHLLVLGTLMFLIIALFCRTLPLLEAKGFRKFLILYNIALPFMAVTMLVRGILEVKGTALSSAQNAMISGFAGISHILMLISLVMLLLSLKKELLKTE
ncbi:MAG: DUF2871 domain-containing protein [Clostridiales bacterium]|nr:DUF2871 domain-containing protein [Clostridiales bacterium]